MLAQHFIDIPGAEGSIPGAHRIAYTQWGDKNASRTIVCVHGLTRNSRDFDALAAALGQKYRVICPDMPGRGASPRLANPAGYTNPVYVADMLYLLSALGISRVHWIGTSMGGIMGLLAASSQAGLIASLLLNDIGCFIPALGLERIRDIADVKTDFNNYAEAEAMFRKRCEHFGITDEAHWQHLLRYGIEAKHGIYSFTYDPAIFRAGFSKDTPVADVDLWPLWQALQEVPVMLVRGARSDLLTADTASEMQARHPRLTRLEIMEAGHAPALMDPKQTAPILEWMDAIAD